MWRPDIFFSDNDGTTCEVQRSNTLKEAVSRLPAHFSELPFRLDAVALLQSLDCLLSLECGVATLKYDHCQHKNWRRSLLNFKAGVTGFIDKD